MNVMCGTDIIEISRVKDSIENVGEKFIKEIYTDKEIEYCESKGKQKYQHYAARFAAKEAIFKAISKELSDKYVLSWKNYEVLNEPSGRPFVNVFGFEADRFENIDVSISHCKDYSVANVVVLTK